MTRLRTVLSLLLLFCAACLCVGCTLFPEKKNPSLTTTTSAEQTERLFWQAAVKKQSTTVSRLIAAQAVFTMHDGTVLDREQFVQRIEAAPPVDFAVGQVLVRPQGTDIVLSYPASIRESGRNVTAGVTVLSVWQQAKSGWVLVAHSETPAAASLR